MSTVVQNNQIQFFVNKTRFLNANYQNESTKDSYSTVFRNLVSPMEKIKNKDVMKFTADEIEELMNELPTTNIRVKKSLWSLLKAYYAWGINSDKYSITESPLNKLELAHYLIPNKLEEKKYYSIEEIDDMCSKLEGIGFNAQEILPIVMARYGILGEKLSWLRFLKKEHIDRDNGIVHIFDSMEKNIITSIPVDETFIKWVDKALKVKEKEIVSESIIEVRYLKYTDIGYILKSTRGKKAVSEQGIYSMINRTLPSILEKRIRLGLLANSRKIDLIYDIKMSNTKGRITFKDLRDVTLIFNPNANKYSYFTLKEDYVLLNGEDDVINDFNFSEHCQKHLNNKKKNKNTGG